MKFFLLFVVLVAAEAKSVDPATLAKLKDAQRARAAASSPMARVHSQTRRRRR